MNSWPIFRYFRCHSDHAFMFSFFCCLKLIQARNEPISVLQFSEQACVLSIIVQMMLYVHEPVLWDLIYEILFQEPTPPYDGTAHKGTGYPSMPGFEGLSY